VADDEKILELYTTTAFLASAYRLGFRIGRDGGGDANNSVLQLTELVVEYIPGVTQAHV
jgi:hypothetical protein